MNKPKLTKRERQARLRTLNEYTSTASLLDQLHDVRRTAAMDANVTDDIVAVTQKVFYRREELRGKLDKLLGIKEEDYG